MLDDPELLGTLVEGTRAFFDTRRDAMQEVSAELEPIWKLVDGILANGSLGGADDVLAVAALIHLQNPFDERYDGLIGYGLTDDIKVIRDAAKHTGATTAIA